MNTLWQSIATHHSWVPWTNAPRARLYPSLATATPTDPALLSSLPISRRLDSSDPGGRAGCPTACLGLRKRGDPGGHLLGQGTRKPHGDHTSSPRASHASSPQDRPTTPELPQTQAQLNTALPTTGPRKRWRERTGGGQSRSAKAISPLSMDQEKEGPGKHQRLPLEVNCSHHSLSLCPELLKVIAWGEPKQPLLPDLDLWAPRSRERMK